MSWNNVIPWEVLECDKLCFALQTRCPISTKGWKHHEDCPIGQKLKEREMNERKKDRQRNAEGQEIVGGVEGQV